MTFKLYEKIKYITEHKGKISYSGRSFDYSFTRCYYDPETKIELSYYYEHNGRAKNEQYEIKINGILVYEALSESFVFGYSPSGGFNRNISFSEKSNLQGYINTVYNEIKSQEKPT